MSSSAGAVAMSPLSETMPPPSPSARVLRKRTVPAVTSKDAPDEPSCFCQMRGPPVFLSGVSRPSTSTLEPFLRYWLQISACLPHAEMRNQIVSLTCSPLEDVYLRLDATENDVTAWPEGV